MHTHIRRMTAKDLDRVAELSAQGGYPIPPEELHSRFETIDRNPSHALFVAERDVLVVGWIHVHPTVLIESPAYAEISGIVVDKTVRRSGIGRALMQAAEQFAREHGLRTIRVRSNIIRPEAHVFYPGIGYTRVKTQHTYQKQLV